MSQVFRDLKKDEFLALEQGDIFIIAYEAKFNTLSRYTTQLLTFENKRIHIYIKGLNYVLQALFMHKTSTGKGFNKVLYYVKKFKGLTQAGQAKILANKLQNFRYFSGSYYMGHDQQAYLTRSI